MEKKTGFFNGIVHIFYALSYSLQGILTGLRVSVAIRQECFILVLLGFLGWYTDKYWFLTSISVAGWLLVIVAELFNSAIEEALDLITHEYSVRVKAAKDMGSAAVFILIMINIYGQARIYAPELYQLINYAKTYLNK